MTEVMDRGPDVWLVADGGDEGPWGVGTILDTSRVLIHAPLELLEGPASGLRLVTSSNGRTKFARVDPAVVVLGDGLRPGYVFLLLRAGDAQLRARPDVIDRLLSAAIRGGPVAPDATAKFAGADVPAVPAPPSVPVLETGAQSGDPPVLVDLGPDVDRRPWPCFVVPWLCHPAAPRPDPGGPSIADAGSGFQPAP